MFGGLLMFIMSKAFGAKPLTDSEIGGMITGSIGLIIILINVINQLSIDKNMNFRIRIDDNGIGIDDTIHNWDNIYETAIMKKTGGKGSYNFLVVAMNNMSTYESYDLTNFKSLNPFGFGMTLAKYIEHFKPSKTIGSHQY